MDYSPLYVRASDQHLFDSVEHTSLTGDFTAEWWWKPASLSAGEDQTFYQVNHTLGGTPVRIWKTDNAGSPRLRLRCQEVGGPAPLAAEHVEVEWDISALVSIGTWVHLAIVFDVSQPVATIAVLYADSVSQGNGTVISGTDCSSIIAGNDGQRIGSNGSGAAVDGRLFDWRLWLSTRTLTEIQNNYQLVQTNSNSGTMRQNLYKSGQHHYNAAAELSAVLFGTETNGPISFAADIPANMNQSVGTVDGELVVGSVGDGSYSGLAWSGAAADLQLMLGGDGQEYLTYTSGAWSGAAGSLVELSGTTGAPAFIYRMRAYDSGLGRIVYWTTEAVDTLADFYTGPGPLSDIVVSAVICQG